MSRFVKPQVARLPISDGDYLDVKARLNAGEQQDLFSRMLPYMTPGQPLKLETRQVMTAKILAYLVGWSLTDDGKPVPYSPDMTEDARLATLSNLDPDTFAEIKDALDAHIEKVDAERDAAKKSKDGENASSATSPSVDSLAGATSGSTN